MINSVNTSIILNTITPYLPYNAAVSMLVNTLRFSLKHFMKSDFSNYTLSY